MSIIKVSDKEFAPFIPQEKIENEIQRIASEIKRDMQDKEPLFLVMLNGAFMFASDLVKEIEFDCMISFIKVSSYAGTASTGQVKELIGLDVDVRDRDVLIIEDIVESGLTMHQAVEQLRRAGAKSVEICSFVHKPMKLIYHDVQPKYIGLNIKDSFIIGYGLDIDGYARNLPEVYELAEK